MCCGASITQYWTSSSGLSSKVPDVCPGCSVMNLTNSRTTARKGHGTAHTPAGHSKTVSKSANAKTPLCRKACHWIATLRTIDHSLPRRQLRLQLTLRAWCQCPAMLSINRRASAGSSGIIWFFALPSHFHPFCTSSNLPESSKLSPGQGPRQQGHETRPQARINGHAWRSSQTALQ